MKNEGNLKINELNKDFSVIQCERNMIRNDLNLKEKNFNDLNNKLKD